IRQLNRLTSAQQAATLSLSSPRRHCTTMANTVEPSGGGSLTSRTRAAAVAAALKVPLALLCLVGTAVAVYYFVYVTDKKTYLVDRNFRLLATIGREIEASIENDQRILASLARSRGANGTGKIVGPEAECDQPVKDNRIDECASSYIPILRSAEI